MEKTKLGIYKILNIKTNSFYIGSSKDLERRKYNHFSKLKENKHKNKKLQADFNKFKAEYFKFIILEEMPNNTKSYDLAYKELYYIYKYKPTYNKKLPVLPEKKYTQNDINKVYLNINI
ncbi:MAG: GIY-YIG nuclease family protein [Ignavibacteria bacterium]|jgi:group I intron endonuclease